MKGKRRNQYNSEAKSDFEFVCGRTSISARRRVLVYAHTSSAGAAAHVREWIPARLASIRFGRRIELDGDGVASYAPGQASGEGFGIIVREGLFSPPSRLVVSLIFCWTRGERFSKLAA